MVRRVHIGHVSFLSPIGNNWDTLHENLLSGTTGVRKLEVSEVPADFPIRCAAKIRSPYGRSYSEVAKGLGADMLQVLDASTPVDAIVAGYRDLSAFTLLVDLFRSGQISPESLDDLRREKPLAELSKCLEGKKIRVANERQILLGNACATGNSLLGIAFQRIRLGQWQRALVFGIELDSHPLQLMSIFLLGALSSEAGDCAKMSRPFSASRKGFVKGEGAALLLLESEEALRQRGGKSLGEIVGYANLSDAWNLVEGRGDGSGVEAAMANAISDAQLCLKDIDYVKAHATGTIGGDAAEVTAICRLFSEHRQNVFVHSLKSMLGHSTIVSGLLEFICVLDMLRHGYISPNLNLEDLDPELKKSGLKFIGSRPVKEQRSFALLNSIGFGGQNSSLIVKRVP